MAIETTFTKALTQKIHLLTVPQQKMATYVLENPFKVALYSIDEFAQAVQSSTASANRFAKALGYAGYAAFRQDLIKGFESVLESVHRLKEERKTVTSIQQVFSNVFNEVQNNLETTRHQLTNDSCEKAVQMILAASRVYILGFGSSGYLSGIMERRLFPYNDMAVSLSTHGGISEAARRLTFVKEGDLILAISFPRYLLDTIELAKKAKSRGAKILALTDKLTAPIVPIADCVLYGQSQTQYGQNSEASTLALIEGLLAAVDYASDRSVELATEMAETLAPWLVNPNN
ncbi:transcriptional regulator [Pelistega indica]|uniref:Transcriptional regulator n=1 Tax=Pelistega indica TaxID=1414851 RepID=V8G6M7_9BURK|nr:MurR/RpiR family transcriptional regulator [Pelistega indica]ETD72189.1 transcriptional regulator [Pelistega indica]